MNDVVGNYFTISDKLILKLLENKIDGELLCALMVLAKNSDKTNEYSYANIDCISKTLNIGRNKATDIIERLLNIHYYTPIKRVNSTFQSLNKKKFYVINKYSTNKKNEIYFSNEFVGNKNDKINNISLIFKNKNVNTLIKLLIMIHKQYCSFYEGGINNIMTFGETCDMRVKLENYDIVTFDSKNNNCFTEDCNKFIASSELSSRDAMKNLNSSIDWLIDNNFINKYILTINDESKNVLYPLDIKGDKDFKYKNCRDIEPLIRKIGINAARGNAPFRFYDRYAAIAPTELVPSILGIYKPTFFPSCSSLKVVQKIQAQQQKWQENWGTWFNDFQRISVNR